MLSQFTTKCDLLFPRAIRHKRGPRLSIPYRPFCSLSQPDGSARRTQLWIKSKVLGDPTRALQVKKENGVKLGRPRSTPDNVVARIVRERTEGKTAYAIARDLNKDAVPTAQGARAWSQATVRALLMREGVR